jgi:hypothetical protein
VAGPLQGGRFRRGDRSRPAVCRPPASKPRLALTHEGPAAHPAVLGGH